MNLSEHFTLEEMVASQIATRRRLDNRPGPQELANLKRVCVVLEEVRALVGAPVTVSSGFRSKAVNQAVGGAANSAHLLGLAADINVPGMAPKALAKMILASNILFDQLIYEGTWVHIGLSEDKPRREVLTANFNPGGVVYSRGIA
ncbi:D-Ala-D-Ala carboxypeptidase family metallohydrolase [Pseudoduganella sp. RAF19]|uniref:D-Ala-D-Ala carboxypeptidase family metallohydrolase n=1 Tax=Bacteria TaxID=2 RepID=UPI003F98ED13